MKNIVKLLEPVAVGNPLPRHVKGIFLLQSVPHFSVCVDHSARQELMKRFDIQVPGRAVGQLVKARTPAVISQSSASPKKALVTKEMNHVRPNMPWTFFVGWCHMGEKVVLGDLVDGVP